MGGTQKVLFQAANQKAAIRLSLAYSLFGLVVLSL